MKKRIIPSLLIDSGGKVVISRSFDPWRTVGMLMQSLKMHEQRGADELLILDISATKECRQITPRILNLISENLSIPVTVGGGIHSLQIAKNYITLGADKICVNSCALYSFELISQISNTLGSQAVVVNINYVWMSGKPVIYNYLSGEYVHSDIINYLRKIIDLGVGEIILSSVVDDGSLNGFDFKIIDYLCNVGISVPIVISGGGGTPDHFVKILSHEAVSAACGGSIFVLTEHTPHTLRDHCRRNGISMRY